MIKPEECNNINDVRLSIDEIDKEIIRLISLRARYVKRAAAFKKNENEVKADNRVKKMLETRRLWAEESGINPDIIEKIYRELVDYFINHELKEFNRK